MNEQRGNHDSSWGKLHIVGFEFYLLGCLQVCSSLDALIPEKERAYVLGLLLMALGIVSIVLSAKHLHLIMPGVMFYGLGIPCIIMGICVLGLTKEVHNPNFAYKVGWSSLGGGTFCSLASFLFEKIKGERVIWRWK